MAYLIWREPDDGGAFDLYFSDAGGGGLADCSGGERIALSGVFLGGDGVSGAGVSVDRAIPFQAESIWPKSALVAKPAHMIDGEMVSWYGSRAIAGLDYLVALRRSLGAREVNRAVAPAVSSACNKAALKLRLFIQRPRSRDAANAYFPHYSFWQ